MVYSIGEVAKMFGINSSTLRYYDKQGLFLKMSRSEGGKRLFTDFDIKWLGMIEALKTADMSIEDIRKYVELYAQGDEKLEERYAIVKQRRSLVEEQIKKLQDSLEVLNFKCWYYEVSIEAGTANAAHEKMINDDMPADILAYHKKHKTPVPVGPLYSMYNIAEYIGKDDE